ncbi:SPOR domain-containing protein [Paenibacillus harenae]|uniref:SPOR domain-containing protein n=1 Tax=Paenibacillus harenae TaxID=306543 RepID=UPI000411E90A|nr:SPOR domain-containing protein [Paenibacillus harenae]
MNQKNRITYRFDRAGNSITEDNRQLDKQQETASGNPASSQTTTQASNGAKPAKVNVIPLYPVNEQHSVSEISPWNSAFQEDISALEKLIRDTDAVPETPLPVKPARPQKNNNKKAIHIVLPQEQNEEHEYALPNRYKDAEHIEKESNGYEEVRLYDESTASPFRTTRLKRSTKGPSWFNVFLSVAGALATGALFGYLLLSLFTGAPLWPGGQEDGLNNLPASGGTTTEDTPSGEPAGSNSNKVDDADSSSEGNGTDEETARQTKTVSLKGLEQTYYMLQFGVFSNTAGRDAAIEQLAGKGLAAAAMTSAGDYRVYAGMAGERSKAQAVRSQLSDLELFIKEITVTTPGKIPFNGEPAVAEQFFQQTAAFIKMLDELTLAQLEQPSLSPIGKAAAEAWQAEHQQWTESAAAMQKGVTDDAGKDHLAKLVQSVNTAAMSMTEYNKKASRTHLWSAQSELMKAVLGQKEWFESISAL